MYQSFTLNLPESKSRTFWRDFEIVRCREMDLTSLYKLESHTVLRLPPDLATQLRNYLHGNEESDSEEEEEQNVDVEMEDANANAKKEPKPKNKGFTIMTLSPSILKDSYAIDVKAEKALNGRMFHFNFQNLSYPAVMWDLPCIVEAHKTLDKKHLVKTGDIGQILIVSELGTKWEEILPIKIQEKEKNTEIKEVEILPPVQFTGKKGSEFKRSSGLTPPTTNITQRVYKRTSWHNKYDSKSVSEAEAELIDLLSKGNQSNALSENKLIIEDVMEEPEIMKDWVGDNIILTCDDDVKKKIEEAKANLKASKEITARKRDRGGIDSEGFSGLDSRSYNSGGFGSDINDDQWDRESAGGQPRVSGPSPLPLTSLAPSPTPSDPRASQLQKKSNPLYSQLLEQERTLQTNLTTERAQQSKLTSDLNSNTNEHFQSAIKAKIQESFARIQDFEEKLKKIKVQIESL